MINKKKLLFSIIVVSLNTKKKFIKTINSIVNQNIKDYEIIVVDGKSSDGTINEIKSRKNLINKTIIEKDRGIYHAMNKGIKIAQGSWIVFLNSGDKFFNKNVLFDLKKENIKYFDVIYGDTIIVSNKIKYLSKSKKFFKQIKLMPFCHQSTFTRKELFKQKKFDTNFQIAADFEFFYFNFKKKKKFKRLNKIFSIVEGGGLSDTNRLKVYSEYKNIFKKYNKRVFTAIYFLYSVLHIVKSIVKSIVGRKITGKILKLKYTFFK